ncbi:hypothetical protein BVC80_8973g10 [Macleaya cordata]|uniref:Uncharacterized protein n=1 Tax=Macleaya cordata TaxID=56857 RepID=A0A200PMM9_MACCD|nr:hypothetical protein BVC80_8973g10 [Macleaya cordata]
MESNCKITADEVISQLKDEGDFDRLRLKIIRKLKENEELRNNIISAVKQSTTLNRPGAENLKPRQLSDAIHDEIGTKVMGQISDGVWGVIRSSDGMKDEIRETVESVYNRLVNPKGKKVDELSSLNDPTTSANVAVNNNSLATSACEREDNLSESEPKEPPGFTLCNQQSNISEVESKEETQPIAPQDCVNGVKVKEEPYCEMDVSPSYNDPSVPPGFAPTVGSKEPYDVSDEDPDVPPGFG